MTRLVSVGTAVVALVAEFEGPGVVWAFDSRALHGERAPTRLGEGVDLFATAPDGGAPQIVIVSELFPRYFVRSVRMDGSATPPMPVPDGYMPQAALSNESFLLGSLPEFDASAAPSEIYTPRLRVWNRNSGSFAAELGNRQPPVLIAAAGATIVWRDANSTTHEVHVPITSLDNAAPLGSAISTSVWKAAWAMQTLSGRLRPPPPSTEPASRFVAQPAVNKFSIGILDVTAQQVHTITYDGIPSVLNWSPDGAWLYVGDGGGMSMYGTDTGLARRVDNAVHPVGGMDVVVLDTG